MKSALREILPTIGLGLLTIVVVVGGKQIVWGSSPRAAPEPMEARTTSGGDDGDVERRLDLIEKAVGDLRTNVAELRKASDIRSADRLRQTESAAPPAAPTASVANEDNRSLPLARGLDYVARGTYDDAKHGQILIDLAAAYAVPGLTTDVNNALRTTIQQVNDIGTEHIIAEARSLPRQKAIERLKIFLAVTPKLTPQQKARINAAVAAYQRGGAEG